jgi:hypothetical protein
MQGERRKSEAVVRQANRGLAGGTWAGYFSISRISLVGSKPRLS